MGLAYVPTPASWRDSVIFTLPIKTNIIHPVEKFVRISQHHANNWYTTIKSSGREHSFWKSQFWVTNLSSVPLNPSKILNPVHSRALPPACCEWCTHTCAKRLGLSVLKEVLRWENDLEDHHNLSFCVSQLHLCFPHGAGLGVKRRSLSPALGKP